jgi:hypothetical protein
VGSVGSVGRRPIFNPKSPISELPSPFDLWVMDSYSTWERGLFS